MAMRYTMRLATADDAAELLAIYAPYVETTTVSFEWDAPTPEQFRERIEGIMRDYPYLVYTDETGKIVGYAYAHRQKERAAYRWNAETSIYLLRSSAGKGLGKSLYRALFELLRLQNVENVFAGVTSPNVASQRMHESLGFKVKGIERSTGYKFGRWHDVVEYELAIGPHEIPPGEFIPFPMLGRAVSDEILPRYTLEV